MVYFNFLKVAPAAPNDPVVNEVTQINNNWDHLDLKLQPYMIGGTISGVETGQEFFDSNFRYAVWDGAATIIPDDIDAGWSAWTNFPIASGRFARAGFTPKWRNNSLYRMVECTGGFNFDAGAGAWPMGTAFLLNGDTSGSPPASMVPVGGRHVGQAATALTGGTSVVAAARIVAEIPGGSSFVRLTGQYMGAGGGGNFIQLDQVWWWY